ncbi:MAG: glucose-6-phosphate dehydrogenase assembly protein OpcA [Treponemataceae bacterium]|nr:glucose-6-phosphate dehydrogenase assembly protein OpcA [Treponemataceae bacterium]
MIPLKSSLIEKELYRKVEEATGPNARAMSATIVGLSHFQDAALLDGHINSLLGRRPVRVIHLRGNSPGESRYWIEARCSLDRHNRGVCLEDIYIETPGDEAYYGRIWGSLTVRELPVLLYWGLPSSLLASCQYDCSQRSDVIVFESEKDIQKLGMNGDDYLNHLRTLVVAGYPLVDLTWELLWPHRFALSRLFMAPYHERIAEIRRITVISDSKWKATLFTRWCKERLSSYEGSETIQFIFSQTGSPFTCTVECTGSEQIFFRFETPSQVLLGYPDGFTQHLVIPHFSVGHVLERLVDSPTPDALYARLITENI